MYHCALSKRYGNRCYHWIYLYILYHDSKISCFTTYTTSIKSTYLWRNCFGVVLFGFTNIGNEILKHTSFAHIAVRVENFKDPYNDVYGDGYQPANSLYGIASSNIVGKGIGNSARKYGYLTQADNDYILAVLIEETGIFGLFGLVILYGIIEFRLFYYAFKTSENMYKIILGGAGVYLFMHFFLNAGGVASLIPFTGVPLLFISSGGTSLISVMLTMGLAQNCICAIRRREMDRLL